MTDRSLPFTVDVSAVVIGTMLIYADSIHSAHDIAEERRDELIGLLAEAAGIRGEQDDNPLTYTLTVSPARGYEVAGSEALFPGSFRLVAEDDYSTATDFADSDGDEL